MPGRLVFPTLATTGPVDSRLVALERGVALVEEGDAILDALERLDDVTLEAYEDTDRVLVRPAPDVVGVAVRGGQDLPALALGGLGQAPFVDEEGGLFLGLGHDPLGLGLGLLDDPLALGVDPLGGADLFGDRDAELIDEAERRVLVDDDVGRERQLLAVGDEGFEALDKEDDVDERSLQADGLGSQAGAKYRTPGARISGRRTRSRGPREPLPGPSWIHRHRSPRSP